MMPAMFVSGDGRISLQNLEAAPARINGLVRCWALTGLANGLAVYEQSVWQPLQALATAEVAEQLRRGLVVARELQAV